MDDHAPGTRSHVPSQQNRFKRICVRLKGAISGTLRAGNQRGQALTLNQRGQALVEYMLVLIIALTFTHQVFFNQTWGFKGMLQKTMLRLGSFLEQNLKSGTKVGGSDGKLSLDPYAGTDRWSN
jgi:hypothetical protein